MASSRSSTPADPTAPVERAVAHWVAALPAGSEPVAIALSGGRDSMVLLDAAARALREHGRRVFAFHVHHGLQAAADDWPAFCASAAAERGVDYAERRVTIARAPRASLEAAARDARYAALRALARDAGACAIALAHHQDDQAETLLLQLGRGAGPAGLAAMPAAQRDDDGFTWWRPLLGLPRASLAAYAGARALRWVDDPSNADVGHRRNAVRTGVAPAIAAALPGYPATLARAASHQADAAELLNDLAAQDADAAGYDAQNGTLPAAPLAALPASRARNLLRWFLRARALPPPSAARLDAMLRQLAHARGDATIALPHAGAVVGRHRGRVVVHGAPPDAYRATWRGEASIALPHGELRFEPAHGAGVDVARIESGLEIRPRQGGERMQLAAGGAHRALKSLLREAALPPWERDALPLVVCGDTLIAVPGVGVDVAWRAAPGQAGLLPVWCALAPAPA